MTGHVVFPSATSSGVEEERQVLARIRPELLLAPRAAELDAVALEDERRLPVDLLAADRAALVLHVDDLVLRVRLLVLRREVGLRLRAALAAAEVDALPVLLDELVRLGRLPHEGTERVAVERDLDLRGVRLLRGGGFLRGLRGGRPGRGEGGGGEDDGGEREERRAEELSHGRGFRTAEGDGYS